MGKGTNHASDWKMTTLKVAIDARRLYVHSVKIMGNEKVFKPSNDFRGATLLTIHETLLDVYIKTWEANRINVAKNPSLANERLTLQRFALASCHNGFYGLSCDVRHYYDTMRHDVTNDMFAKTCDEWTARRVSETLDGQYRGEKGYNPGSQMVQIAGISYLNGIDHYIKERLKTKMYVRYMDDFHLIGESEPELREKLAKIGENLSEIGMELHPDKTSIHTASSGVGFLGYNYKITESGKVLVFRDRRRVKEVRRRMTRLAAKIRRGNAPMSALGESYRCVRSALAKGNSKRLLRRMDDFYKNLEKEIDNGADNS